MIRTIIIAVLCILAPSALEAVRPAGFNVRYDVSGYGETSYINMPRSSTEAKSLGWIKIENPVTLEEYSSLVLWCPSNDFTIGVWFDDTGYPCGLQIALHKDYLSEIAFDLDTVGLTNWTTTENGEQTIFYVISQYFISPELLALNSATRTASRNASNFLQESAIYLTGPYQRIYKVLTDPSTFAQSNFTKQKCIAGMGTHYYYNMTSVLECTSENMFPWFLLEDRGRCVGSGFFTYGKRTIPGSKFNYMERYYTIEDLKSVFVNASDCVYKYGNTPGLIEMHIYYIESPYNVTCDS